MLCERDVAALITRISTYQGHLPTGSPASPVLAFYANTNLFSDIDDVTRANNVKWTCYVDDLSFSGTKVTPRFTYLAKKNQEMGVELQ